MNNFQIFKTFLLISIVMAGLPQAIHAQSVRTEFWIEGTAFNGSTGGVVNAVATLAGQQVDASAKVPGTMGGCDTPVEGGRSQAILVVGRTYLLTLSVLEGSASSLCGGWIDECTEVGASVKVKGEVASGCGSPFVVNYCGGLGGPAYATNHGHSVDGVTISDIMETWQVTVAGPAGLILFEPLCGDKLPADGKSTTTAYLKDHNLNAPITWSIPDPNLGCRIDGSSGLIRAGYEPGTITVRATDANGCYLERELELTEAGCADCGDDRGDFGDGEVSMGSVRALFHMGISRDGESAKSLRLHSETMSPVIYTPEALDYPWKRPDVEVIRDANQHIKQVRAPQGVADVVVTNANVYAIKFYRTNYIHVRGPDGYEMTTNAMPHSIWTIENPGTTNRLRITKAITGQNSVVSEYLWLTNGWALTNSGLRVEKEITTYTTNAGVIHRIDSFETRSMAGTLIGERTEKFLTNASSFNLVQETWGSGATAKTNLYEYVTVAGIDMLQKSVRADGSWEHHSYDSTGRCTNVLTGFMNQGYTTTASLCRSMEYSYSTNVISGSGDDGSENPGAPRRTIERIKGEEIGRSYVVYNGHQRRDIQCVTPGAEWTNVNNLVTITKTHTNSADDDKVWTLERPDGTIEIYLYPRPDYSQYVDPSHDRTNIVMRGQPDAYKTNIVDGSMTIDILTSIGLLAERTVVDIASGITNAVEIYSDRDDSWRPQKVTYLDGTYTFTTYSCCGEQSVTNREGTVTVYARDALKRIISTETAGIITSNMWDAAGNLLATIRRGTDSTLITNFQATYDTAGRMLTSKDGLNNTTSYSETIAPIVRTTTYPNATTRIESHALDGNMVRLSGTAARGIRFTNNIESADGAYRLFSQEIRVNDNGTDSSEWAKTYEDGAGRPYKTIHANVATNWLYYNAAGQLNKEIDPDGVITLYAYNTKGEREYTVIDMDRDGVIDWAGTDRITRTARSILNNGTHDVIQTRTWQWNSEGSGVSNLVASFESTFNGRTNWQTRYGVPAYSEISLPGNGYQSAVTYLANGTHVSTETKDGRLLSRIHQENQFNLPISHTTNGYDPHGRMNLLWDAGTGPTGYRYDNADRLSWTTNQLNLTTRTEYNSRGWVTNVTEPDNATIAREYFNSGELKKQYGARTSPVEYTYDYAGRMKTMKTWQDFAANSGTATTTWSYDANRGFMTNKAYADATQVGYAYTTGGRLKTRRWARGVYTTNHYDNAGVLTNMTYSDSMPSVTKILDRLGRVSSVVHGTNTTEYQYGPANQVLSERFTAGMLSGLAVSNLYDSLHRRTTNGLVDGGGTWLTLQTNRWGSLGQIQLVGNGSTRISWSFKENTPLIGSMTHWDGSTIRAKTIKSYDSLGRLTKTYMTNGATVISSNAYAYNNVNQRTSVTNAEGARWAYEYDSLGQVTSGKRYWSDGVPVAGQQFEYGYDDIGNREYAGEGGNEWGTGLRYEHHTVNSVNQYTQRTVPGYVDVLGTAKTNSTVTVNDTPTYRKADYFRGELPVTNNVGPIWISLTNLAVLKDGANPDITTNAIGNEFVPKNPETFTYDLDGNQTSDGRWTNRWDAENRLISVESHSIAPDGSKYKIIFAYDSQWRRTSKIVSNWVSGAWAVSKNVRFAYDGWNLIAELNATNNAVINSYLWGLDLSNTPQGAGGVGGLLAIKSTGNGTHFTAFDANGNITALTSVTNASVTAQYEYDPFLNLIRETGPMAKLNDFAGTTKRLDRETERYYYGYRHLAKGRWLSRDPIDETGGQNIYGFVGSDGINRYDLHGLFEVGSKVASAMDSCNSDPLVTPNLVKCGITINAGHAYAIDEDTKELMDGIGLIAAAKWDMNMHTQGRLECAKNCYVGCGSTELNKAANAAGIGVPGLKGNFHVRNILPGESNKDLLYTALLNSRIRQALDQARKEAKRMCEQNKCSCPSIKLWVYCHLVSSKFCGYKESIKCR